jgi:phosphoenolpyruvate---glycerone phosphotransferase subunit DhaL
MSSRFASEDAVRPAGSSAPTLVTVADLRSFIARAETTLVRHRACLDRLDARLGDGDHGENMSVGFGEAVRTLVAPAGSANGANAGRDGAPDPGEVLRRLGDLLVASVGGAGGSLYGTAFIEAGLAVAGRATLDAGDVAAALNAAAEGIARRGRCRRGDKTIYDALRPAADAFADAVHGGLDTPDALARAAGAARAGMLATRPLIARRGLALRLGEASRGQQDPGATSCFLLVRALLAPASSS